jgi:hypothetical protein
MAKEEAYYETIRQANGRKFGTGLIRVTIYFYPPDKRGRDSDNMLSSCKAYLDGIAQGLKVNDVQFNPVIIWRAHPVAAGLVKFVLVSGGAAS